MCVCVCVEGGAGGGGGGWSLHRGLNWIFVLCSVTTVSISVLSFLKVIITWSNKNFRSED